MPAADVLQIQETRRLENSSATSPNSSAKPQNQSVGSLNLRENSPRSKSVDALITRLATETDATRRRDLLSALCRLYNIEGAWAGDSWGTRPDHRGPYYQPEPWSDSPKIADAILKTMPKLDSADATWLGKIGRAHV